MEIYILDALLRPIDVVDTFVSVIWTERFNKLGEFELVLQATTANRKRFVEDTVLASTNSNRVMRVHKTDDAEDEDNGSVLKVTGPEISDVFKRRVLLARMDPTQFFPKWHAYDMTPANVMRTMVDEICATGTISAYDVIPLLEWGTTLYSPGTIPEPTELIAWEQEPTDLCSVLENMGEMYDLGFRLYKDPNLAKLYFDVYSGSDRTTGQTLLPPVIFAPDMNDLQSTSELRDISNEFNVVIVLYIHKPAVPEGDPEPTYEIVESVEVVDPNADISAGGFVRKVKMISITSLPEEVTNVNAYLTQLGKEELRKSTPIGVFDGEIDQFGQYLYERDYFLGDLVEVRNATGATAYMRVTEQIIVEDGEGERSYPTLVTKIFASPGTWKSWKYDVGWSEMGADEYWNNQ